MSFYFHATRFSLDGQQGLWGITSFQRVVEMRVRALLRQISRRMISARSSLADTFVVPNSEEPAKFPSDLIDERSFQRFFPLNGCTYIGVGFESEPSKPRELSNYAAGHMVFSCSGPADEAVASPRTARFVVRSRVVAAGQEV